MFVNVCSWMSTLIFLCNIKSFSICGCILFNSLHSIEFFLAVSVIHIFHVVFRVYPAVSVHHSLPNSLCPTVFAHQSLLIGLFPPVWPPAFTRQPFPTRLPTSLYPSVFSHPSAHPSAHQPLLIGLFPPVCKPLLINVGSVCHMQSTLGIPIGS